MTDRLKPGTRIATKPFPAMGGFPVVPPEKATIIRTVVVNNKPENEWYEVRFYADGSRMHIHRDSFTIDDT